MGVGEKIENFELFHPDRIAQRILGMEIFFFGGKGCSKY